MNSNLLAVIMIGLVGFLAYLAYAAWLEIKKPVTAGLWLATGTTTIFQHAHKKTVPDFSERWFVVY